MSIKCGRGTHAVFRGLYWEAYSTGVMSPPMISRLRHIPANRDRALERQGPGTMSRPAKATPCARRLKMVITCDNDPKTLATMYQTHQSRPLLDRNSLYANDKNAPARWRVWWG
jgi:hypothetical protein